MRFAGIPEMPFADIEADIRFELLQRIHQADIPLQEFAGIPAGTNGVDQGVDRFLGIKQPRWWLQPPPGTHATIKLLYIIHLLTIVESAAYFVKDSYHLFQHYCEELDKIAHFRYHLCAL